jgi:GTPase Era involved in 16S rRNA processing
VINKIDLQNNKKKLKELVMELEDLARFDKTFYISCITGYGIDKLCEYLESEWYKDYW